jgi:hypothetical protein
MQVGCPAWADLHWIYYKTALFISVQSPVNKHQFIYRYSWGPDDDGQTVDGPHHLASLALRHGVDFGRQGYGSIYVVASGNGGSSGDNCNYDGYANSIFTITIGAVDESGHMPYYGEECASMLAVTFSSGSSLMRSIVCIIVSPGQMYMLDTVCNM